MRKQRPLTPITEGGARDHGPKVAAAAVHPGNGDGVAHVTVNDSGAPPRHDRPTRRGWVPILFVYAWVLYTLVQGGSLIMSTPYVQTLQTAPRGAQGAAGDGYAQTLIKLERTLPAGDRVLLIWRRPDVQPSTGFWYGYFWATYWLYPRPVDVVTSTDSIGGSYATLLDVRAAGMPAIDLPAGYSVSATYTYIDQVVTVLRRDHA